MLRPLLRRAPIIIGVFGVLVLVGIVLAAKFPASLPWGQSIAGTDGSPKEATGAEEAGHNHSHDGSAAVQSLALSEQAQRNIGLKLEPVKLDSYQSSITVPAIVVERPGVSRVEVTAPTTGIITAIHVTEGEAVETDELLFEIKLTHEEIVQAQSDLLRTVEELDVIGREVERLQKAVSGGSVAGKALLERKYEQQKQEAALRAQRQQLTLHGMTEEQVEAIVSERKLLQRVTVSVPAPKAKRNQQAGSDSQVYQVQSVKVDQGQAVKAGDSLLELANLRELFLRGDAFEQDIAALNRAVEKGWKVRASADMQGQTMQMIKDLEIAYVAPEIDPESRVFRFYVPLPNKVMRETKDTDDRRFVYWQFKPGQRMQIMVPVETFENQIVLPITAVVQDGPESYVFVPNGGRFERRPVHEVFRDRYFVVVANDGSLYEGENVIFAGASQMQIALKNMSGGAVDPHAGHNH